MDMAENGTDYPDLPLESWIEISNIQVPAAVYMRIILLVVATFILQLGLVLALICWSWRRDRRMRLVQQDTQPKCKAASEGTTYHPVRPQRECSEPAMGGVYIPVASLPHASSRRAGTANYWDLERDHFPPWDLVQSP